MSITVPKEYEKMFGKQDFVVIPKSLYLCLPKILKSKISKKVDVIFNCASKTLKTKEVKNLSAIL